MPCIINAESGTGLTNSADGSGLLKVQSGGKTTNALAWVNFNGTGTVAIRSSYNVSSITDNGAGSYTVNFATALSDANYCALTTRGDSGGGRTATSHIANGQTTLSVTIFVRVSLNSVYDVIEDTEVVNLVVFGN